jgi:hypothetical protein
VAGKEMHPAQMFTGALDQLAKLDKYASELATMPTKAVDDVPGMLKNIGKYGSRFGEIMERAKVAVGIPNMAALDKVTLEFTNILMSAKNLPADAAAREAMIKDLIGQATSAMENLNKSHLAALKDLQVKAGLHGASGVAEALASMSRSHMYFLLAKDRAHVLMYQILSQYGRVGAKAGVKSDSNATD